MRPNQPEVSADQLVSQFGSVITDPGRPKVLDVPLAPSRQDGMGNFHPVSQQDVLKLLSSVDENKASGSDGIPCRWL